MSRTTTGKRFLWLPALLALALVAAACGSDSASTDAGSDDPTTTAAPDDSSDDTEAPADTEPPPPMDEMVEAFDANGDGVVTIGVAAAGPANDGAYYQAVVDAAQSISAENGFADPIVVDEIQAADAATALSDLAAQVDILVVGASEIAEPLGDLTEKFPDVYWYCNCGAGFPDTPGLAQALDDGSEIGFTAGAATALLLGETDQTEVVFIGCCDLGFEKEFFLSFQMGLTETNAGLTVTYVPSGDFPFDFNNVANATEALSNAVAGGAGAVVPYLGEAHRPVVQAANEAGIITMSAGSSTVCDASEELDYSIAVRFDGGDYIRAIFPQILSGDMKEGDIKRFLVGVDDEPGAVICNATDEQQAAMDEVYAKIAAGDYAEDFGAIKGEAYAG